MSLLLITQTLLLPLTLSFVLFYKKENQTLFSTLSFLLIWLLSYFWIMGLSVLTPIEALDWLWLSSITILVVNQIKYFLWKQILTVFFFITSLIIYSWPIIQYKLEISILFEIFLFTLIVMVIIFHPNLNSERTSNKPAIIICIGSSSLAISVGLSGSIIIAQLVAVLSATLAGFVFIEICKNNNESQFNSTKIILSLNIYLALLFIGSVYAELPLAIIVLLAISPLTIVLIPKRFNWIVSLLLSIGAVLWILFTSDVQEFY